MFCFFNIYICLFGVVLASTAGEMRDTSVFCLDIGSTGGHWVGRIALWVGQWVCGGLCLLHVWIMNHLSGACGVASIVAAVIEAGAQRPEVWATFLAPRTSHRISNGILEVVGGWVDGRCGFPGNVSSIGKSRTCLVTALRESDKVKYWPML